MQILAYVFYALATLAATGSTALAQSSASPHTPVAVLQAGHNVSPSVRYMSSEHRVLDTWRLSMEKTGWSGKCATAKFPAAKWTEIPCGTRQPDIPTGIPKIKLSTPSPSRISPLVTPANDLIATVSGNMNYAHGSFYSAGVVNEDDLPLGPGLWSAQLNSNIIPNNAVSQCAAGGPSCAGWVQFIYQTGPINSPIGLTSAGIRFWLLNYVPLPNTPACAPRNDVTCPCPTAFWAPIAGSCTAVFTLIAPIGVLDIANLDSVYITGSTYTDSKSGKPMIRMIVGTGDIVSGSTDDDKVGLSADWNQAEFNVFGNNALIPPVEIGGNPDMAIINPATGGAVVSVSIKVAGAPGAIQSINCVSGGNANRSNNLIVTVIDPPSDPPQSCLAGYIAGWNQILFTESNPPTITSITPISGTVVGGTKVDVFGTGFIPSTQANDSAANGTEIGFGGDFVVATCDTSSHCMVQTPASSQNAQVAVAAENYTKIDVGLPSAPGPVFAYLTVPEGTLETTSGPTSGGTKISIDGTGLSIPGGSTQINFQFSNGSASALGISCGAGIIDQTCTAFTPPLSPPGPGPVAVPVTLTVGGQTSNVGTFTYGPVTTPPPCGCGVGLKCCLVDGVNTCVKGPRCPPPGNLRLRLRRPQQSPSPPPNGQGNHSPGN